MGESGLLHVLLGVIQGHHHGLEHDRLHHHRRIVDGHLDVAGLVDEVHVLNRLLLLVRRLLLVDGALVHVDKLRLIEHRHRMSVLVNEGGGGLVEILLLVDKEAAVQAVENLTTVGQQVHRLLLLLAPVVRVVEVLLHVVMVIQVERGKSLLHESMLKFLARGRCRGRALRVIAIAAATLHRSVVVIITMRRLGHALLGRLSTATIADFDNVLLRSIRIGSIMKSGNASLGLFSGSKSNKSTRSTIFASKNISCKHSSVSGRDAFELVEVRRNGEASDEDLLAGVLAVAETHVQGIWTAESCFSVVGGNKTFSFGEKIEYNEAAQIRVTALGADSAGGGVEGRSELHELFL